MNIGKTLFAQLMDFLPWSTFTRIVTRYGGDQRVRTLSCAEHYRAMVFAQLTYRESLRDIETCLSAQASKLYAMGFRDPVRRSTLADANERRDWRIYAELAQRLIARRASCISARIWTSTSPIRSSAQFDDHRSLPGGVSVGAFRTAKAAVKMHTLLDLRGNIPSFIHISTASSRRHALDLLLLELAPSMSWIAATSISAGFRFASGRRVLHHAREIEFGFHRVYSAPADSAAGIICDQTIALGGYYTPRAIQSICAGYASAIPKPQDTLFSSPTVRLASRDRLRPL